MKLSEAEKQISDAIQQGEAQWKVVAKILNDVQNEKLFSPEYRSFSKWITAFSETQKVQERALWRYLKSFKYGNKLGIDLPITHLEQLAKIQKQDKLDKKDFKQLVEDCKSGTVSQRQLQDIARPNPPKEKTSAQKDKKQQKNDVIPPKKAVSEQSGKYLELYEFLERNPKAKFTTDPDKKGFVIVSPDSLIFPSNANDSIKKKTEEYVITGEMENIIMAINNGEQDVFVTGGAGVGKSVMIKKMESECLAKYGECVLLAPTGMASINVGGSTLHKFYRMPPGLHDLNQEGSLDKAPPPKCVIIDEVSMVRSDTLNTIRNTEGNLSKRWVASRSREIEGEIKRGNPDEKTLCELNDELKQLKNNPPRTRYIYVGDFAQLPPIVKDDEQEFLDDNYSGLPYAFHHFSDVIMCPLTHVFRQKDKEFIDLLNKIRFGECLGEAVKQLNATALIQAEPPKQSVTVTTVKRLAKSINDKEIAKAQKKKTFEGYITGVFKEKEVPVPVNLVIADGMRALCCANTEHVANGEIGTVKLMGSNVVFIKDGSTREKHTIATNTWENVGYAYKLNKETGKKEIVKTVLGKYEQIPILPAYAITIHKSQGQSYENVHVNFGSGSFAHGQAYVALSRSRSMQGLSLSREIKVSDIIFDPRVNAWL